MTAETAVTECQSEKIVEIYFIGMCGKKKKCAIEKSKIHFERANWSVLPRNCKI